MKREITYVVTNLSLQAPLDLAPLAKVLAGQGLFLYHAGPRHNDSWDATFTIAPGFREPDQDIAAMLTVIEALDEPSQTLWRACTSRDFNINFNCGDAPWFFNKLLSRSTLARIAAAGADLTMTINPVMETDAINAAVDILRNEKRINDYIGEYESLGIHQTNSLSIKRNQTEVKVTLTGTKGSVYVHCLMQLTPEGEWAIKDVLAEEERFPPTSLHE